MTYPEIKSLCSEISVQLNMPFAIDHFSKKTAPPFLLFELPDSDDFYADGKNYQRINELNFHFCSDFRDFNTETALEAILTNHEIAFTKSASYIDDQAMWQISYYTEVIIDEHSPEQG